MLNAFLGMVLAAATALSGFGYLRHQEKDDWRGAVNSLLRIPERNRLIVFLSGSDKDLFDYYSRTSPAMGLGLTRTALRYSFLERFPLPQGQEVDALDVNRLKLFAARNYSEIDLVLSHHRDDPAELALNYLSGILARQEEQHFVGIRIVRFKGPLH